MSVHSSHHGHRSSASSPHSPAAAAAAASHQHQPAIADVLAISGLRASSSHGGQISAGPSYTQAFSEVATVVARFQAMLQDNEATLAELESSLGDLEEKARTWSRRAERAELERDDAVHRSEEAVRRTAAVKKEVVPLVESFMEAEVLKSQHEALHADLQRLGAEEAACHEEHSDLLPHILQEEEAEAECIEAIAELERAHTEEVCALKALHLQEIAELSSHFAQKSTEIETTWREEIGVLRSHHVGDLGGVRSALEDARWQADTYSREHKELVHELTLRQRENARIARRHGEARQEATELAVKLEALQAAEAGAPVQEAELHALQQRETMLRRMYIEWQKALRRKTEECKVWRTKAMNRGVLVDGVDEEDFEHLLTRPLQEMPAEISSASGPRLVGDRPVATPARTANRTPPRRPPSNFTVSQLEAWFPAPPAAAPAEASTAGKPPKITSRPGYMDEVRSLGAIGGPPPPRPAKAATTQGGDDDFAGEFVNAVLKAARLRAEAEAQGLLAAEDSAAADGGWNALDAEGSERLQREILEAENEVEMLTFLLEDDSSSMVEAMLEQTAAAEGPSVARRLRIQRDELAAKRFAKKCAESPARAAAAHSPGLPVFH